MLGSGFGSFGNLAGTGFGNVVEGRSVKNLIGGEEQGVSKVVAELAKGDLWP